MVMYNVRYYVFESIYKYFFRYIKWFLMIKKMYIFKFCNFI